MKKLILPLLILLSFFFVFSNLSHAQGDSIPSADMVVQQESLEKEIEEVNASYRGQLETYRRLEKEYQIALDQYQKHQTLISIEEAVKATKKAMQSRNEVLTTYLTLLKLELLDAKGIEVSQKSVTLSRIDSHLAELKTQKTFIDEMSERIHINKAHDDFIEFGKTIKQISEEAQILLAVGKLQSVYDKAIVLQKDISALVNPDLEVVNRAAKTRALNETDMVMNKSYTELQNYWNDIGSRREKQNVYSLYNNHTKVLNPIYADLSQVISYFNEFLSL